MVHNVPFPLSINGSLNVQAAIFPEGPSALARLRDALVAQTVDSVTIEGDAVHFKPHTKGNARKPRPEGNLWMLDGIGSSWLAVRQSGTEVKVEYHLDTSFKFVFVSSLALLAGSVIHLFGKTHRQEGWVFAAGIWLVMFASSYVSATIEFRRWLRANLTSREMPPTKPLRVPPDPD
jgi:hypothetical protein